MQKEAAKAAAFIPLIDSRSLIDAAGHNAAVNDEQVTGDKARGIGSEKDGGTDEFLKLAETPHRGAPQEFFAALRAVQQGRVHVRTQHPGDERIDAHTGGGPLDGEGFCERGDACFAGAVSGNFEEPDQRRK